MKCVKCGGRTSVLNSRPWSKHVYRRRECMDCKYRFSTNELYKEEITMLADAAAKTLIPDSTPEQATEPVPRLEEYQFMLANKIAQALSEESDGTVCEIMCQDDCKAKNRSECAAIIRGRVMKVFKNTEE